MRILWVIVCLALLAIPAHARPKPPPPSDFRGNIYVDSLGCVFNREDKKWVKREVDGQQVCGFPHSFSPFRQGDSSDQASPPSMDRIEHDLLGILASGLHRGEATADDRPREYIAPAPPVTGQDEFNSELTAMMGVDAKLQAAMSGSFNANDICARLGYQADLHPRPVLGWDVTMGLCPEARALVPQARIWSGQRVKTVDMEKEEGKVASSQDVDRVSAQFKEARSDQDHMMSDPKPRSKPAAQTQKDRIKEARTGTAEPATPAPEKRYVEVGGYRDDQSARQAIRELTKLGYPAAQAYRRVNQQTVRFIYAGPFDDQEALNTALGRLRREGYMQANIR